MKNLIKEVWGGPVNPPGMLLMREAMETWNFVSLGLSPAWMDGRHLTRNTFKTELLISPQIAPPHMLSISISGISIYL